MRQDDDKYPLADHNAVVATNSALYSRLNKKTAEVTTIEDVVYELNTQVKQLRLKIDLVLQDLRAAESGRDDNKFALARAEAELSSANKDLARIQRELDDANAKREELAKVEFHLEAERRNGQKLQGRLSTAETDLHKAQKELVRAQITCSCSEPSAAVHADSFLQSHTAHQKCSICCCGVLDLVK